VVADAWQGRGIGRRLVAALIDAAKARGLRAMEGEVLPANEAVLRLARSLGFSVRQHPEDPELYLVTREL
jgi:acetyltransferase